jgi:hypothetical protein
MQHLWNEFPDECEQFFWEDTLCPKIHPDKIQEQQLEASQILAKSSLRQSRATAAATASEMSEEKEHSQGTEPVFSFAGSFSRFVSMVGRPSQEDAKELQNVLGTSSKPL